MLNNAFLKIFKIFLLLLQNLDLLCYFLTCGFIWGPLTMIIINVGYGALFDIFFRKLNKRRSRSQLDFLGGLILKAHNNATVINIVDLLHIAECVHDSLRDRCLHCNLILMLNWLLMNWLSQNGVTLLNSFCLFVGINQFYMLFIFLILLSKASILFVEATRTLLLSESEHLVDAHVGGLRHCWQRCCLGIGEKLVVEIIGRGWGVQSGVIFWIAKLRGTQVMLKGWEGWIFQKQLLDLVFV